MTKQDIIEYCSSLHDAYEDYPFDDFDDSQKWTVMRHKLNKKSFAIIYERDDKICVNVKCDPIEADFLRQIFADVIPAYHMNKTHWNTIFLNGDVPEKEVKLMITKSFDLTKPK